ncbi:alpha/beta fold hydrolase [Promicromonospora thailandica]|uniref:Pimeloyl-ACP methyl ester carboxylesterase n=1 Tax=Promicromonospora thailandica TaxID=765201 RepID=A0A9X2GCU2_9MICO|nr:alpha/beta hydrolase [Promicromonospora thailandica]MCP2267459.1 Pimeloyl-ACP methyl ester carboxylesterase [Promicromonospora thailandica]BFF21286.1 alpha/beta hydrolase [Promicromonospora thailandica]
MTHLDTWTPTTIARNGDVELAYDRIGHGGDVPLLLMMGLAISRFWWPDGLCRALADEGFDVVRYDQRDTGESTRFGVPRRRGPWSGLVSGEPVPYTAEDVVDDAAAVLDAAGIDRAVVLGHSLGGVVAQRFALRHPRRTLGLVSCDSLPSDALGPAAVRYLRPGLGLRLATRRYPGDREGDVAASLAVAKGMASPATPCDEDAARARIERGLDRGPRDTRGLGRQVRARWHGPRLRHVTAPTLVLHGADDPLIRTSAARATARQVRGATLMILPDVGHDLPPVTWRTLAREARRLVPA